MSDPVVETALARAHREEWARVVAGLARRFGETLLLRLDQALARRPEPLAPLSEAAAYAAARGFLDPIGRQSDIVRTARDLMAEIAPRLERDGLVTRSVTPTIPPRVDYELTELGHSLRTPVEALGEWAFAYQRQIAEAQIRFDGGDEGSLSARGD